MAAVDPKNIKDYSAFPHGSQDSMGLTRRDWFASRIAEASIAQGGLPNDNDASRASWASWVRKSADALMAELDRKG